MIDTLKHLAGGAAAIVALTSASQALILAFGGSFPPWATAGEVKELQLQVRIIIAARDYQRCEDANRRLKNSMDRFRAAPSNTFELENIEAARNEIRMTPNCMVEER